MKTRVSWWIRDGDATWRGEDYVSRRVSLSEAEALLDHATAKENRDLKSLPKFCSTYYGCAAPDDWGITRVECEI